MKKFLAVILASSIPLPIFAQDKALLETLVKKGMLTQQEATQIAKESVAVVPASKATKSIRIYGGVQGWFKWANNDITHGNANMEEISGFELRYVKVGLQADVGNGWSADIVMDFGSEGDKRNYLDKVIISKAIDVECIKGEFQIGMRKSEMGIEQTTDDFKLLAIDRSVATNFFTRAGNTIAGTSKCFGSRTVGVFWNGEVPQVEGLHYGLAATSEITEGSTSGVINNINANSGLSYYVSVGYKNIIEFDEEVLSYDIGLNTGYASKGFTTNNIKSEILGLNPYLQIKYANFTAMAEFFYQDVDNGKHATSTAEPMGVNFILAYKFDMSPSMGAIEPVLRFSYVSANSMGIAVSSDNISYYFDEAKTVYIGANWYMTDAIKTSIGYEYGKFTNGASANARELESNTILAQLQVVF